MHSVMCWNIFKSPQQVLQVLHQYLRVLVNSLNFPQFITQFSAPLTSLILCLTFLLLLLIKDLLLILAFCPVKWKLWNFLTLIWMIYELLILWSFSPLLLPYSLPLFMSTALNIDIDEEALIKVNKVLKDSFLLIFNNIVKDFVWKWLMWW